MFSGDDIVFSPSFREHVMQYLSNNVTDSETVKSDVIDLSKVRTEAGYINTHEIAANTTKFLIRANKWLDSLPDAIRKNANAPEIQHNTAGLQVTVPDRWLQSSVLVNPKAIVRELSDYGKQIDNDGTIYSESYTLFTLTNLSDDFIGDPKQPILNRALWLKRRHALQDELNYGRFYYRNDVLGLPQETNLPMARGLIEKVTRAMALKPTANELFVLRQDLLDSQARRNASEVSQRRALATQRFTKYWQDVKSSMQPADPDDSAQMWTAIPLKPAGTTTSRTWGIEIETLYANETSRPVGWDSRTDGSLPDGGGCEDVCDCRCDSCDEGDHCYDCYDECHYDCDRGSGDSREFVSPVLNSFNSDGLRHLCSGLQDTPYASEAGIHVHVGANDLSVVDVANLLMAYSAVEKLLQPLLHRQTTHYCKPTTTEALTWWLAQVREFRRLNPNDVPTPAQIVRNAPNDRYYDVNIHALTAHGTIEFRAMGAHYHYDHLVRWAWFAREMVNVSRLGIDLSEWTRCKSLRDVINVLRKYGSELPSNELFRTIDSADLDLSAERELERVG